MLNFNDSFLALPPNVKYSENKNLSDIGGFLVCFGNHHQITCSSRLTVQEKAEAQGYLLGLITNNLELEKGIYIWFPNRSL